MSVSKEELFAMMSQNDQGHQGYDDTLLQNFKFVTWDNSLPTLKAKECRHCECYYTPDQIADYILRYMNNKNFGLGECFLRMLKIKGNGQFILAGGSVCGLIHDCEHRTPNFIKDFDVFAVNMLPKVAEDYILQFIHEVKELHHVDVYRTPGCITAFIRCEGYQSDTEIQFITRTYSSIAQVLYGFDIAAAAVALTFDNSEPKLLMTPLDPNVSQSI